MTNKIECNCHQCKRLESYIDDLEELSKKAPSNQTLPLYQILREVKEIRSGSR